MTPDPKLFALCTGPERGTVILTQEGLDVIRSILMRWIMQAEKGESAAKALAGGSADQYAANQAAYFRNAASFLLARLTSHLTARINLRDSLPIITRWQDGEPIPPRWVEMIDKALSIEDTYGTLDTPVRRSGGDQHGHDGKPPMDSGPSGKVDQAKPPASPPRRDPAEGGVKTRPSARRPRNKGA